MPLIIEDTSKQEAWKKQLKEIISENSELEFPTEASGVFGRDREETHSHLTYEGIRRIFPSPDEHSKKDPPNHLVVEVQQRLAEYSKIAGREFPCFCLTYWFVDLSKNKAKQIDVWWYLPDKNSPKTITGGLTIDRPPGEFPADTSVSDVELKFDDDGDPVFGFILSARRSIKL